MEGMMSNFGKGVVAGISLVLVIVLVVLAFRFFYNRDMRIYETLEVQHEIQELREDVINRDPYEFLDTTPGVRGAADSAADEFRRKRDEALQRFRSRLIGGRSDPGSGGSD
jgi:hypothetical protein